MKVSSDISLIKQDQKKFVKKTQRLKQRIKAGKLVIRRRLRPKRRKSTKTGGLIYIAHLPHGFYENEIRGYFSQFGAVLNVKVCRSPRTGNSKGYGYVEFEHEEVAKIAAETMNNYLMFKKKLTAIFVPNDKRPPYLFKPRQSMPGDYSALRRRRRLIALEFQTVDETKYRRLCKKKLNKLGQKLENLEKLGIHHRIEPVDVPEDLQTNK